MEVDWAELEAAWHQGLVAAITETCAAHPSERFYAGAFWLLYGDYTTLAPPVFGLNSETSAGEVRWHPPDWRWSELPTASETARPHYEPMRTLDVPDATFEALWERHIDVLAVVCRRVTEEARAGRLGVDHQALVPGFFVGIIDFSHGADAVDYLKRSVDPARLRACGILDDLQ